MYNIEEIRHRHHHRHPVKPFPPPTHEEIAELAYEMWQLEGGMETSHEVEVEIWIDAENMLNLITTEKE